MRINFKTQTQETDWFGLTQDEVDKIVKVVPNWEWEQNGVAIFADGWNPIELLVVDQVKGFFIIRFGRVGLVDPTVTTIRDAEWCMTGDEVVLVGRFGPDGFDALIPD